VYFFFQAEDGIRDFHVTGVQTCALPIYFIDIYYRTGLYPHPLPHGLGFEAAGVLEAVGADVAHLKKGDRVAYGQSPNGAYAQARSEERRVGKACRARWSASPSRRDSSGE